MTEDVKDNTSRCSSHQRLASFIFFFKFEPVIDGSNLPKGDIVIVDATIYKLSPISNVHVVS